MADDKDHEEEAACTLASMREQIESSSKNGEELVHRRLKVWWPLDNKYYEGVVASYDPSTNRHEVSYDDGDEEILDLREEKWEIIEDKSKSDESPLSVSSGSESEPSSISGHKAADFQPLRSYLTRSKVHSSSGGAQPGTSQGTTANCGDMEDKSSITRRLQAVKLDGGKSYTQLAKEIGLTNVYIAQLFRREVQLNSDTAHKLQEALPDLPKVLLDEMMKRPVGSFDPNVIQKPNVNRLYEVIVEFGESIREIIKEEFGDGVMSAMDLYCSVRKVKGVGGEDRVVVTFDGKYEPHIEQKSELMVSTMEHPGSQ